MPLDPLQRRPHRGRWPEVESDDFAAMLPPAGPQSPTVVTVPADAPPAWPPQAVAQLVKVMETVVVGASGPAAVPGRPRVFGGATRYRPFGPWE